jgi:hypothetical protein
MTASRSASPEHDTALPHTETPITTIESESYNDLIPEKRKLADMAPSQPRIIDNTATVPPAAKKSKKGKEVEKPSSKAAKATSSKKKPRSEYILVFSNLCSIIHTNFSLRQCYIRFRYRHSQRCHSRTILRVVGFHRGNFRPTAHCGFRPSAHWHIGNINCAPHSCSGYL